MGRCINNHGVVNQGVPGATPPEASLTLSRASISFDNLNNPCDGNVISVDSNRDWTARFSGSNNFTVNPDFGEPGITEVSVNTYGELIPLSDELEFLIGSLTYGSVIVQQYDTSCP